MVADIARVTYDPTRQYRALIRQQGRVTLEADGNEAAAIALESLRLETIDIFGPAAALGAGYEVSIAGGAITIGPGIFYLGGWRLALDAPVDWAQQPDWIDAPTVAFRRGDQVIALLLTEQSVSAVEDLALREVALGGPDSAARDRLMQHFLRIAIDGDSCAAGASAIDGLLAADGVSIDPATQSLVSAARLQAGFVPGPPVTDPCQPAAAGGYLGADNQMVRVTITAYDPTAGTGTLLWGWNNASLLYRATASDPVTLTLTNVPVDEEHAPQIGQMVEILQTEADLGDGNLIADNQGFVTSLAQAYSFDTGEIVLADALPAAFQNNTYPLFVRLWQAAVPFTAGQATPLDAVSGITVTVTLPALPSNIAGRPFWHFAVRPATPQAIYPQRYLDAPQPPDGPRQWIADLAIVGVNGKSVTVVADCRVPWVPIGSEVCDCCGLTLDPNAVAAQGGLQAVVDSLAGAPARLSLKTGTYPLAEPLVLTQKHTGLTIEGCNDGVFITAETSDPASFITGLVRLAGATQLTLRNLAFQPPAVPVANGNGIAVMIGILITSASDLMIEDCVFTLSTQTVLSLGAGIAVQGPTQAVTVRGSSFTGSGSMALVGILAWISSTNAAAAFDRWEIVDNSFSGLLAAVIGYAQLGLIRCSQNIVTNARSGFIFAEANLGAANAFVNASQQAQNDTVAPAAAAIFRQDMLAELITNGAPIVAALNIPPPSGTVSDEANAVLLADMRSRGTAAFTALAGNTTGAAATSGTSGRRRSRVAPAAAAAANAASNEIEAASLLAEIYEPQLTPAVRIENNEIALASNPAPWIGIGVIQSPSDQIATSVISGNRVTVPNQTTIACGLFFPAAAVVSGNIFLQLQEGGGKPLLSSLVVLSESSLIQASANAGRFGEQILPARTNPPATASWDFLNTL